MSSSSMGNGRVSASKSDNFRKTIYLCTFLYNLLCKGTYNIWWSITHIASASSQLRISLPTTTTLVDGNFYSTQKGSEIRPKNGKAQWRILRGE
jgi:hypothetical protein